MLFGCLDFSGTLFCGISVRFFMYGHLSYFNWNVTNAVCPHLSAVALPLAGYMATWKNSIQEFHFVGILCIREGVNFITLVVQLNPMSNFFFFLNIGFCKRGRGVNPMSKIKIKYHNALFIIHGIQNFFFKILVSV